MGIAQNILDRHKERRSEVNLEFPKTEIGLLNAFLREYQNLPMNEIMPPLRPYQAKDKPGAKQIAALQRWLEKKVMEKKVEGTGYKFNDWSGSLPKVYVERLLEIVKHYEPLGMLPTVFMQDYWSLRAKLEGEKPDFDDIECEIEEEKGNKPVNRSDIFYVRPDLDPVEHKKDNGQA
jgi:hypothetical protein